MKIIKNLVHGIDEELCDAQKYAEMYVEEKAKSGGGEWTSKFRTLAEQELAHAMTMHDYAVMKINEIRAVYTPSQEMLDKWDESHKDYVDRYAWIKQMLSM